MSSSINENIISNTIIQAIKNGAGPSKKNNDYRYYHCHLDWNGLKCTNVKGPEVLPIDEHTKLLFVKSYFPEQFDSTILKYKWIPNKVIIEKKST